MWKALILICHVTFAQADCTTGTAADVIQGPSAPSSHGCLFQAMAYAAGINLRLDGHYLKITCVEGRGT